MAFSSEIGADAHLPAGVVGEKGHTPTATFMKNRAFGQMACDLLF